MIVKFPVIVGVANALAVVETLPCALLVKVTRLLADGADDALVIMAEPLGECDTSVVVVFVACGVAEIEGAARTLPLGILDADDDGELISLRVTGSVGDDVPDSIGAADAEPALADTVESAVELGAPDAMAALDGLPRENVGTRVAEETGEGEDS